MYKNIHALVSIFHTSILFSAGRQFENPPQNFNEYISKFSQCIVHIINFEHVDFNFHNSTFNPIPLVLTRLQVVQITIETTTKKYILPFEKLNKLNTTNWTHENWKEVTEKGYLHANGSLTWSKSFHCGAHLYLFPPFPSKSTKLYYKVLQYSKAYINRLTFLSTYFWTKSSKNLQRYQTYYYQSQINYRWHYDILIAKKSNQISSAWIYGLLVYRIWDEAAPSPKWAMMHWEVAANLNTIKSIHLFCYHCTKCSPFAPITINWKNVSDTDSFQYLYNQLNKIPDNIIWKIHGFYPQHVSGQFKNSNGGYLFHNVQNNLYHRLSDQKLLYIVFGNATYHMNDVTSEDNMQSEYCLKIQNNGCGCSEQKTDLILHPQMEFVIRATNFPLQFRFHKTDQLFVACGHLQGSTPFYELISSYDQYSWLTIIGCMITLVPLSLVCMDAFWRFLNSQKRYSCVLIYKQYVDYAISAFKNLLEQGFVDRSDNYFRCVSAFMMLMAVILSNAYKGDNITKLISPLPPIPFTMFDQLVQNGFKIYSVIAKDMNFKLDPDILASEYKKCRDCYDKVGTHCFLTNVFLKGENNEYIRYPYRVNSLLLVVLTYGRVRSVKDNSSDIISYCGTKLKLSSREKYILNQSMIMTPKLDFSLPSRNLGKFGNCDKNARFAVILDEHNYNTLKVIRAKFGERLSGPISFGKEVLASFNEGIIFKGWIPQLILMRMQSLYSSGIMAYFDQFMRKSMEEKGLLRDFQKTVGFQASNLKGSIKVVFVVLPVGFLVALMCMMGESGKIINAFTRVKIIGHRFLVRLIQVYALRRSN